MAEGPDELTGREPVTPGEMEELGQPARSGDEMDAARADVEQARAQMGETVDAIQERLDPQRVKEQAKTEARERAGSAGSGVLRTLRQYPVPVAIAGGLLGLLVLRRLRG